MAHAYKIEKSACAQVFFLYLLHCNQIENETKKEGKTKEKNQKLKL